MKNLNIAKKNIIAEVRYKNYFDKFKSNIFNYILFLVYLVVVLLIINFIFLKIPFWFFQNLLILIIIIFIIIYLFLLFFLPREKIILTKKGFTYSFINMFRGIQIYSKSKTLVQIRNYNYKDIVNINIHNNFISINLKNKKNVKIKNLSKDEINLLRNNLNVKRFN